MTGFGGMNEHRRRAGGRQRGSDLAPHMTAFAHAHDHHAPRAFKHRAAGLAKARTLAGLKAKQRLGFDVEGVAREFQGAFGVEQRKCGRWSCWHGG